MKKGLLLMGLVLFIVVLGVTPVFAQPPLPLAPPIPFVNAPAWLILLPPPPPPPPPPVVYVLKACIMPPPPPPIMASAIFASASANALVPFNPFVIF